MLLVIHVCKGSVLLSAGVEQDEVIVLELPFLEWLMMTNNPFRYYSNTLEYKNSFFG